MKLSHLARLWKWWVGFNVLCFILVYSNVCSLNPRCVRVFTVLMFTMLQMPEHKAAGWTTPIWDSYKSIVDTAEGKPTRFLEVERFAVCERHRICVEGRVSTHILGSKHLWFVILVTS